MSALIAQVGTLLSGFIGWLEETLTFMVSDTGAPLGIFILLAILGTVIGMLRRWLPGRA
jgi:hypothetical protein